jgi:RNA polymerase sigma factor (sigma-70 family)
MAMERPVAWIHVVAVNVVRKDWRRTDHISDQPADAPATADGTDPLATGVDPRDALDRLTPRQRAAVVLRSLADLSTRDVAAAVGCAEGTVKATLHQALRRLRVDLGDDAAAVEGAP